MSPGNTVAVYVSLCLFLHHTVTPNATQWSFKQRYMVTQGPNASLTAKSSQFRFASLFHDDMVLQHGQPGAVTWGFGEPNQAVTVTFNETTFNTTVDDDVWRVQLPATAAGGPHFIQASSTVAFIPVVTGIKAVLFGDVWLCWGQSNMEFHVEWMFSGTEEIQAASSYESIRFMHVLTSGSRSPLLEPLLEHSWTVPDSDTLGAFSGLCWVFGRRLYEKLEVPISLISGHQAGTLIRAWSEPAVISHCTGKENATHGALSAQNSVLWNAMVAPLGNLEIKGVIYYQGESYAYPYTFAPGYYRCMFPAMIESWRKHFRRPNLPFGFVQLGTWTPKVTGWPAVRWKQTSGTGSVPNDLLPNVFMAVAMDLPDPFSPYHAIHPRYKEEIAERLSTGALSIAYGNSTPFQGPNPVSVRRENGQISISFEFGPIVLRGNMSSTSFEVCCDDSLDRNISLKWQNCSVWIPDVVSGVSENSISLNATMCQQDTFIRYAWKVTPCPYLQCTVYGAGTQLPAGPFVVSVPDDAIQDDIS